MSSEPLIFARRFGDGIPILIIHGWTMDGIYEAYDYEPIFSKLTGYQRIYVDLPGSRTTPVGAVRNMSDIFLRLVHFVDTTIATSKFLVMGSSAGAYLARALANRYRTQVDGLLLRVPLVNPLHTERDIDPFQALFVDPKVMATIPPEDQQYLSNMLVQTPEWVSRLQSKLAVARPAILGSDTEALAAIRSGERYQLSSELDAGTAKFLAPTLILTGRQDEVVGYRDPIRLLELYPRATLAVLDRENHWMPAEDRNLFDALVRNWLYRVDEWRAKRG